jgi:hypothetical protein
VLLADLRKALQAKNQHQTAATKSSVQFTFANIGEDLSQAPGGGFGTKQPGNWTALKIFLGDGDQEGEFFLNLNPRTGRGQFSMKDPDYGDLVLGELARVLSELPRRPHLEESRHFAEWRNATTTSKGCAFELSRWRGGPTAVRVRNHKER